MLRIVNLIFRIHMFGINYNNKRKGNVFFLKLSETTVDRLLMRLNNLNFGLTVFCALNRSFLSGMFLK